MSDHDQDLDKSYTRRHSQLITIQSSSNWFKRNTCLDYICVIRTGMINKSQSMAMNKRVMDDLQKCWTTSWYVVERTAWELSTQTTQYMSKDVVYGSNPQRTDVWAQIKFSKWIQGVELENLKKRAIGVICWTKDVIKRLKLELDQKTRNVDQVVD